MNNKLKMEILKTLTSEMDKAISDKSLKPKVAVVVEKKEVTPMESDKEAPLASLLGDSEDESKEAPESEDCSCGKEDCAECSKEGPMSDYLSPRLKKLFNK